MKGDITEADKKAMAMLPDGWFFPEHDCTFLIRSPRYRCQRLEEAGILESKVEGDDIRNLRTLYRKKAAK